MSTHTLNLTPEVYAYFQSHSLHEHPTLSALREKTQQMTGANMQISPEQGQLMALLLTLLSAKKVLEVGTFTGYSALAMALALPTNGKVVTCDVSKEATEVAKQYWQAAQVQNKIDLHLAPALTTLEDLIKQGEAGTFDFAFIDADKTNYDAYYEKSLQLLRPGGLIAIDNVLWSGDVADASKQDPQTQAIRALNQKVFTDQRVSMTMIPIGDGLTLARKL